jgi:hypothetical protein
MTKMIILFLFLASPKVLSTTALVSCRSCRI